MKSLSLLPWFALLIPVIAGPVSAADPDGEGRTETAILDAGSSAETAEEPAAATPGLQPAESSDEASVEPETDAQQAQSNETIRRYAEQIRLLEIENGAYNNDLVEALLGLGSAYSNLGEHAEALKVHERALHINRINHGLHNINQIPILEKVIGAHEKLGAYDVLIDRFGYMLWVYKRTYGDMAPELLPVYEHIANWHLHASTQTSLPQTNSHLVIAANLFSEAMELIRQQKGPDDPALIRPLYGIANANFLLVEPYGSIEYDMNVIITGAPMPLLPNEFNTNPRSLSSRNLDLNYDRKYLDNIIGDEKNEYVLIQNSYRSGKAALEKVVEIHTKNPNLPPASLAYALTLTGDWYQRFGKRDTAVRYYSQAYQLLQDSDNDPVVLDGLFGRPLSLDLINFQRMIRAAIDHAYPQIAMMRPDAALKATADTLKELNFALVRFDVSPYGSVRNLEVIASNQQDDVRFRRIARDKISTTPFRPRILDGKPIETENVRMLYLYEE